MRIVICDYAGHPFQVELSRGLAAHGHSVLHLHFAQFQTPKGKLAVLPGDPPDFHVEGLRIGETFDKRNFLRRRRWEAKFGDIAAARALGFGPDVAVGCNMPLDAQRNFLRGCAASGVPFVFWLQDVYSHAIHHYLGARFGVLGKAIGRHYMQLERRLLRSSDAVVAISDKFLPPLDAWGVPRGKISVIPNWAPLSEIRPVAKDNEWAREHGLTDKLVALYSGTLGLKHDPALLADLAAAGGARGLHVLVVSEGPAVDWLEQQKRERGLDNLMLLPFQPIERYPEVLGSGDILLSMVGEEAGAFSVPSKILSYLAAGKPIVAAIPGGNDAAVAIIDADAGRVAPPGDRQAFFDHVFALAADPGLRAALGGNSRRFAERHFDIVTIAENFEAVFGRISPLADRLAARNRVQPGPGSAFAG